MVSCMKYRKYNSTPHSYLHHPYREAQLILVSLMRRLLGLLSSICCELSVNTWWGRWGLWYLKCSYSKQSGILLSHDRHRFRLLQRPESSGGTWGQPLRPRSWIDLCMAWLLGMNLYENSRYKRCTETPPVIGGERERLQMNDPTFVC